MKIAFVIPTFNRKDSLRRVLLNLNSISIPDSVVISKIIINDGSKDGTVELLEDNFRDSIVVNGDGNWWWTKCMNEGFKKAIDLGNDFVLVLNDDIELEANYLITLLNDYKSLPQKSILGSASISMDKPHRIESAGTKDFVKYRLKFTPYFSGFKKVDDSFAGVHRSWTLSGRGTLIPVTVFKEIGFYDEQLPQYGSDDEFCIRANLLNIPVYVSWNARVLNQTNSTSKGSVFKKEGLPTLIRSFFKKHSVNSLNKHAYLYSKYSYPVLTPLYILLVIFGTIKAYYFNYNND